MADPTQRLLAPHPDLGARALVPAWRAAVRRATLRDDVLAGMAATGLSVPLALIMAQSAGVGAQPALVCVVVGSAVVALLGGTTLGISGPGVAASVAVAAASRDIGAAGVVLAGGLCGLLQLLVGALGLGRFARLAPLSVVHGFTPGIGLVLLVQCVPYVLGLGAPPGLEPSHVIDYVTTHLHSTLPAALAMAVFTCAATAVAAHYSARLPAALGSVALCTVLAATAGVRVPRLPHLGLATPHLSVPRLGSLDLAEFVTATLAFFALATLETLLSANALEQQVPAARHDPDQELIGHGVANIALSLLGALPATGSIARTQAARAAGARTRAAPLVHAATAMVFIALVPRIDRFVPLAALAGVVVAYTLPLLDPRPLVDVWVVSRAQAGVLVATTSVIVFGGLLAGIEAGLVAALVLAMVRVARSRAKLHHGDDGSPHQVTFSGPVTFLSVPELEQLRARLADADVAAGVILDVRSVLVMDLTGAARLLSLLGDVADRGGKFAVLGLSPSCRETLVAADRRGLLTDRLAVGDRDVDRILGRARAFEMRAHVVANLERFRSEVREHYTPLFDQLADGQHPHTLFITCVDSRVSPGMITGTHPGEVFIVRCLGAMVSPPADGAMPAEGAAIEYAVGVLGVRNIVVCGHSQCGAIKAVRSGQVPDNLVSLGRWLARIPLASGDLSQSADVDTAARTVTVRQLENIQQFAVVRDRLATGEIELHAWFYDVAQAELYEWNEARKTFAVLGGTTATMAAAADPPLPAPGSD